MPDLQPTLENEPKTTLEDLVTNGLLSTEEMNKFLSLPSSKEEQAFYKLFAGIMIDRTESVKVK